MKLPAFLRSILFIVVSLSALIQPSIAETTSELPFLRLFTSNSATENDVPHFEFSSGGDVDLQYWSTYSSVTWALGKPVADDGLRLRATGGASQYSFNALFEDARGGTAPYVGVGQTGFGDLLVGYRAHWPGLWITALGGASYDARLIKPSGEVHQGFAPRAALETWLDVGDFGWVCAYANYSASRQTFSGTLRFGLRALDFLDLGPETGAVGDVESSRARAGGFFRLTYSSMEMTTSGGVEGNKEGVSGYYGAFGLLRRF